MRRRGIYTPISKHAIEEHQLGRCPLRLTAHTDYALRILLHAALVEAETPGTLLSIAAVAEAQSIARNHAMKVVNTLAGAGLLATSRGRGGGFRLGRAAQDIRLGEVVRLTEPCLRPAGCDVCLMRAHCGLSGILDGAMAAFLAELDAHTLAQAAAGSRLPVAHLTATPLAPKHWEADPLPR
jgi:Rrf2 family nitric oxide-sensitive transcriptional repressor